MTAVVLLRKLPTEAAGQMLAFGLSRLVPKVHAGVLHHAKCPRQREAHTPWELRGLSNRAIGLGEWHQRPR